MAGSTETTEEPSYFRSTATISQKSRDKFAYHGNRNGGGRRKNSPIKLGECVPKGCWEAYTPINSTDRNLKQFLIQQGLSGFRGVSFPTPFRNTFPEFYRGIFPPSTTITIAVISEFVPGFLGNRCSASEIRWFFSCLRASSHAERTSYYVMVAEPVIVRSVSFGW
ncbi:hypothetical protein CDAR_6631 [Caerostris darwini]|uniref:Uncharacterized protein n=1 Tax=Caerostris darwini TaxID=1538125 RepID=A0AAV4S8Q1_9ARAC|nr:hypothetical protein CDAR_6631 [Caerostris darwini]